MGCGAGGVVSASRVQHPRRPVSMGPKGVVSVTQWTASNRPPREDIGFARNTTFAARSSLEGLSDHKACISRFPSKRFAEGEHDSDKPPMFQERRFCFRNGGFQWRADHGFRVTLTGHYCLFGSRDRVSVRGKSDHAVSPGQRKFYISRQNGCRISPAVAILPCHAVATAAVLNHARGTNSFSDQLNSRKT